MARSSRFSILAKLLLAFGLPTVCLFGIFAFIAYESARRELEDELGTRLSAVAASAATQIRGKYLVDLQPGEEADPLYQNARRKLIDVKVATGVARLYVFDKKLASRVDTEDGVAIGTTYFAAGLDQYELDRVFAGGKSTASVLFEGPGQKLYKAGYAAVYADPDKDRQVVLAVGVDAPADFFAGLAGLRQTLLAYGGSLVLAMFLISVVFASILTKPLRRLAESAARMGKGELKTPIESVSRDEIGVLANTMEGMRADLQSRNERLEMMLSGIAHEVRNPLGGMELYVGILRDELAGDPEKRERIDKISRELTYLNAVVSEFLDFARRSPPTFAAIRFEQLCAEVIELTAADASAAGVTVVSEVSALEGSGDSHKLRRVLLNLIRNAIQASENGGTVIVRGHRRGATTEIEVENKGTPLTPEVRARMFEPFFTTREKGTGLGLALVRDTIFDHGGAIEVQSEEQKTVICFSIPLEHSTHGHGLNH